MRDLEIALLVVWRVGKQTLHAGPIDISGAVVDEFLELTENADQQVLTSGQLSHFDPDAEYEHDSAQVLRATKSDVVDSELLELLFEAHINEVVTAADLKSRRPFLYALSTVKAGTRKVYVRATSPVKFPGKTIRGRLTDSFDRFKDPILVFDDSFDFIMSKEEIVILNPSAFERITNSPEAAKAASKRLVGALSGALPFAQSGVGHLEDYLSRNSFGRRKALSISKKAYLKAIKIEQIEVVLRKHKLPVSEHLMDGEILFTEANVKTVLALLNDDIFAGDFSGQEYAAARKSALS